MKSTNSILQIAEYLFLGVSLVGVGVYTVTQEVTFTVVPLLITLFLNLFNRQQVEASCVCINQDLIDLENRLSGEIKDLQNNRPIFLESVEDYPQTELERKIAENEEAIRQLQQDLPQLTLSLDLNQFGSDLEAIKGTLSAFQDQLNSLSSMDLTPFEEQINILKENLNNWREEIEDIKQQLSILSQDKGEKQERIEYLTHQIESLPSRSELEALKEQINTLDSLRHDLNKRVSEESFQNLNSQVNTLIEQFNQRQEPEKLKSLSDQVKSLSDSLADLKVNHQLEEDLQKFREQMEKLQSDLATNPEKNILEIWEENNQILEKFQQEINDLKKSKSKTTIKVASQLKNIAKKLGKNKLKDKRKNRR